MDRGIKIAIVVACLLSLGLGLIWDSVIDGARGVVQSENPVSSMSPDTLSLRIGDSTQAKRFDPNEQVLPPVITNPPKPAPEPTTTNVSLPEDNSNQLLRNMPTGLQKFVTGNLYQVQSGDSWWKIAYTQGRFRFLGKTIDDWKAANPDIKGDSLRVGKRINIPN